MTAAHVAAATVTALLLRRGESVCWWLAALLTERFERVVQVVHARAPRLELGRYPGPAGPHRPTIAWLVVATPLRGPPTADC
jgi:hypothetical protein